MEKMMRNVRLWLAGIDLNKVLQFGAALALFLYILPWVMSVFRSKFTSDTGAGAGGALYDMEKATTNLSRAFASGGWWDVFGWTENDSLAYSILRNVPPEKEIDFHQMYDRATGRVLSNDLKLLDNAFRKQLSPYFQSI